MSSIFQVAPWVTAVLLAAMGAAAGATGAVSVAAGSPAQPPAQRKGATVMPIKEHRSGTWSPGLTAAEQATLFAIANDTLAWCVKGGRGAFDFTPYALTDKLKVQTATFVTLKIGGDLRGCIGSLAPEAELYRSVHDNAVNAALRDPRFSAVTPRELPLLEVDVSILSPIRPIATLDEFHLGEHGIIIEKGGRRAVYLPEVAVEQGWTREETLTSLSRKAGLPADAWRAGAGFKVFSSVVLAR